jgi:hypothetical protein
MATLCAHNNQPIIFKAAFGALFTHLMDPLLSFCMDSSPNLRISDILIYYVLLQLILHGELFF